MISWLGEDTVLMATWQLTFETPGHPVVRGVLTRVADGGAGGERVVQQLHVHVLQVRRRQTRDQLARGGRPGLAPHPAPRAVIPAH